MVEIKLKKKSTTNLTRQTTNRKQNYKGDGGGGGKQPQALSVAGDNKEEKDIGEKNAGRLPRYPPGLQQNVIRNESCLKHAPQLFGNTE